MVYDILIIGSGPAGLTAAIYAARASKKVLVIEKEAFGGLITHSPKVENYPGYSVISGLDLADKFVAHAMDLQVGFEFDDVKLSFEPEAIEAIAAQALERKTGARGLRSIMEKIMMDVMYEIPSDDTIESCVITKEAVEGTSKPFVVHREASLAEREKKAR